MIKQAQRETSQLRSQLNEHKEQIKELSRLNALMEQDNRVREHSYGLEIHHIESNRLNALAQMSTGRIILNNPNHSHLDICIHHQSKLGLVNVNKITFNNTLIYMLIYIEQTRLVKEHARLIKEGEEEARGRRDDARTYIAQLTKEREISNQLRSRLNELRVKLGMYA